MNWLRQIFPFLLLLFVAILALAIIAWLVWRASPRIGKLLAAVVVFGAATFVVAKSVSPAGKYAIGGCRGPGLRNLGITDEYHELSGGIVYDVVDGHRHRWGSYEKEDGQWILYLGRAKNPLDKQKLRFSVLGYYTVVPPIEGNEGGPTPFNRRRLLPFTRPLWIPEWLE